ncbi:Exportin-2 [Nymphon striatum]|nr:Exportin-2 [Nymphon striatum]
MEITDEILNTLAGYLQRTLSPDLEIRKEAEKYLESIEVKQNYPLLLLHLLDKDSVDNATRIASAIAFKNYVKRNWKVIDVVGDRIHENDRNTIRSLIVGLMLKSPEQIQKQLSDAISIIGKEDFPEKWPGLINEMVTKFQTGEFYVINGVLQTAHSLFKKYRYEFRSNALWTEIKFVLENFAQPLTDLFIATMELAKTHAQNPSALKLIFSSLILISKLFYSLNYQDLPEFFEDNMKVWMPPFLSLLTENNKLLITDDEEEAGPLEQLKSQICDNVALYAQKYDEEFRDYLPGFVTAVWNLLINYDQSAKYDLLVSNAIQFLASVAERTGYKSLFEDPSTLSGICQNVIIPNMEFRKSDEELFEDNPEEYIRKDMEGSDVDTRRRAACDLVKALSHNFEAKITEIFSQYVQIMLGNYSKDPSNNWMAKDAAIYLVTSLAAKAQTAKLGITQASQLVNVTDFFTTQILPDLQNPNVDKLPVLKADALKYIMIFRTQFPKEVLVGSIPFIVNFLSSKNVVIHTYAAHAIERFFVIKDPSGKQTLISSADIRNCAQNLLQNLFAVLELPGSAENQYVMRAIMRTFSLLQVEVLPYLSTLLPKLTEKLIAVSRNPSKPDFNHYLFETFSVSIKIVCKSNVNAVSHFEDALFPVFQEILQKDVQEFIPYIFQILSLLLELHTDSVPPAYMALFPCLLSPALWERPGNIHPLVRLLQAYIETGTSQIMQVDKIMSKLLGIFQKLIASKSNDHEGFFLIQSMIGKMTSSLEEFMKEVLILLFQRLQKSKTVKYARDGISKSMSASVIYEFSCVLRSTPVSYIGSTKRQLYRRVAEHAGLIVFFSLCFSKLGTAPMMTLVDSIQSKMFGMVIEKLIIADVQKISGKDEKKITAIGITKLLCETPQLFEGEYSELWAPLLQALIGLFELPEDDSVPDDEHFIEIEDTPSYQSAYSQLVFASKRKSIPFHETIPEPRIYLAQCLYKLSTSHPGKFSPMICSKLQPKASEYLQNYLQAANLTLA